MPSRDGQTKLGYLFPGKKFRDLSVDEKRLWYRTYFKKSPESNKRSGRKHKEKMFSEYRAHYGENCFCCGESNVLFLTIEHLDGGGARHRREHPGGADRIIRDIKKKGWPTGYATLCMNCNFGKWRNQGACPHLVEKAHKWLSEIVAIQKEMDATSTHC